MRTLLPMTLILSTLTGITSCVDATSDDDQDPSSDADGVSDDVATEAAVAAAHPDRGINVDPANPHSRPCSSLGASGLGVSGFVRMPIKLTSADWSWSNGGFQAYLVCLRATLPHVKIIGTVAEASISSSHKLHNPYYSHACDVDKLELSDCPAFEKWVTAFLADLDPKILEHFDIIEVFNEPDDKWTGNGFRAGTTSSMPPKAYSLLLEDFNAKFRSLGKPIMMGGMDSGQTSYLRAMRPYTSDFVNIHPYGTYPSGAPGFHWDTSTLTCTSQYSPNGYSPCFDTTEHNISTYKSEYAADGGSGGLIISEWGTGNVKALPGLIRAFFHDPTLTTQNAVFFAYSDTNKAGFGLTDDDGHKTDAFTAFQKP